MKIIKLLVQGLVQVLVAFLVILVLEGALRLIGLGDDPPGASQLKYQQVYLPILEPAERADGTRVFQPVDKRLPYQSIRQDKSKNALRIITFGGSATAGLGYSANVSFARYFERMLERSQPGREIEVVNLGIVALSSKQVKVLIEDACRRYDPDLVVIYSGNNEFLEIHARKYAQLKEGPGSRILASLQRTNTFRFLDNLVRGEPGIPALAEQEFSSEDLRLTQRRIVEDIDMSSEEITDIIDQYESNIDEAVASAQEAGARVILMEVGSNWKWRGREDLPEAWLDDVLGPETEINPDNLRRARVALTRTLQAASPKARSEFLFQKAVASERLGEFASAKENYRAALNEDPHLRRATDSMNERLGRIARQRNIPLLETVSILAERSSHGIVGFEMYYDYVHFTPRGALFVAAALLEETRRMALVGDFGTFVPERFIDRELDWFASATRDHLDVERWIGMGTNPDSVEDRDLWKYERLVADLDTQLESDDGDPLAHVYRGNIHYFELDGAAAAARHYRSALSLSPDQPEVRRNLELLERAGRLN